MRSVANECHKVLIACFVAASPFRMNSQQSNHFRLPQVQENSRRAAPFLTLPSVESRVSATRSCRP